MSQTDTPLTEPPKVYLRYRPRPAEQILYSEGDDGTLNALIYGSRGIYDLILEFEETDQPDRRPATIDLRVAVDIWWL